MCSFGLALFVVLEYDVLLQPDAAVPPRKSIWERLGGTKVRAHYGKVQILQFGDSRHAQMDVSGLKTPR